MTIAARPPSPDALDAIDQRVILHGVSWADYERIIDVRGERAAVRIAYLDGDLELIGRLDHRRIELVGGRLVRDSGR